MKFNLKSAVAASVIGLALQAPMAPVQASPVSDIVSTLGLTIGSGAGRFKTTEADAASFINDFGILASMYTYADFVAAFTSVNVLSGTTAAIKNLAKPNFSATMFFEGGQIGFAYTQNFKSSAPVQDKVTFAPVPGPVAGAGIPFMVAGAALWMRRRNRAAA